MSKIKSEPYGQIVFVLVKFTLVLLVGVGSSSSKEDNFFRVNYEPEHWEILAAILLEDHTLIHELNRARLVDDAFNIACAAKTDYSTALNLAKYLKNETDTSVLPIAKFHLGLINAILNGSESGLRFQKYFHRILELNLRDLLGLRGFTDQQTGPFSKTEPTNRILKDLSFIKDPADPTAHFLPWFRCLNQNKARIETWVNENL